jgi:hypothetical protein
MVQKHLKVFQAHLGFYDTIVAAPSRKAALEAWRAGTNEFVKGFAGTTDDPLAVSAALAHPGAVLKRPFGSKGPYKLKADPVPVPKLTARQRRLPAAASKQRKLANDTARKAAERELRQATQQSAKALAELEERESALEREKTALQEAAKTRIAPAQARLARSAR